jgi:hypothetical protein
VLGIVECGECGQRKLTVKQLASVVERNLPPRAEGEEQPRLTEAVVGRFLVGGTVRSDVLDALDAWATSEQAPHDVSVGRKPVSHGQIPPPPSEE